mmetsp:Transcript_16379/g.51301  ORF Transcript_16379/g.51301 Transcript_16379/m.51301 type:complete len:238 (+) Transcript_16379:640-1353(+)
MLRHGRAPSFVSCGHGGTKGVHLRPEQRQLAAAVPRRGLSLTTPDALRRGLSGPRGLRHWQHRGPRRHPPRRPEERAPELRVQVPPRDAGRARRPDGFVQHLCGEQHRLPPPRDLRDGRFRRRLQLLGQGLEAAPDAVQEGGPDHLDGVLLAVRRPLRLRAVLRLVARLRVALSPNPEPDHDPPRPEGRDHAAQQEAGAEVAIIHNFAINKPRHAPTPPPRPRAPRSHRKRRRPTGR